MCEERIDQIINQHIITSQRTIDAVIANDYKAVRLYLQEKDISKCVVKCPITALHYAAGLGRLYCLFLMLDSGADMLVKDEFDRTPLDYAAYFGHEKILNHMLKRYQSLQTDPLNQALSYAAYMGHVNLVKLILEKVEQLNPNIRWTNKGIAEVILAGRVDDMKHLIKKANPQCIEVSKEHQSLVKLDGIRPFVALAVANRDEKMLAELLKLVNFKAKKSQTTDEIFALSLGLHPSRVNVTLSL
nr:ankyrin repeat domain containing protein 52 [Hymenolepis microstoma]